MTPRLPTRGLARHDDRRDEHSATRGCVMNFLFVKPHCVIRKMLPQYAIAQYRLRMAYPHISLVTTTYNTVSFFVSPPPCATHLALRRTAPYSVARFDSPQHPLCTDDRYRMAIRRRYDDSTPNLSRISPQSPGNSSGGIQPCALSVPPPPRACQWRASPLHWPRNAVALR